MNDGIEVLVLYLVRVIQHLGNLLELYKKKTKFKWNEINQFTAGNIQSIRKRKRDTTKQIQYIVDDYENRNKWNYSRGIAYNLTLNVYNMLLPIW